MMYFLWLCPQNILLTLGWPYPLRCDIVVGIAIFSAVLNIFLTSEKFLFNYNYNRVFTIISIYQQNIAFHSYL